MNANYVPFTFYASDLSGRNYPYYKSANHMGILEKVILQAENREYLKKLGCVNLTPTKVLF